MKPTSISTIEYRLARHDRRAQSARVFPATDYYFRPQPVVTLGRAGRRISDRARRAFHRMNAEMRARHQRDEPLELILFGFVTAIAAWPLVSLLIVLAQTANG